MRHLTVGEMAKLNHISEQTLRLYDKRGLLSPSFRGQNGYRYYDIKQSAVLDIIQYMKSLGISLKEIKHQLENRDLGRIEAALREKQRQTEEEIRLLKCQRRALERTVESFARWARRPAGRHGADGVYWRAADVCGGFRRERVCPRCGNV